MDRFLNNDGIMIVFHGWKVLPLITENGDTASAINDCFLQGNVFGLVARLHNGNTIDFVSEHVVIWTRFLKCQGFSE